MLFVVPIINAITIAIGVVGAVAGLFAFGDALLRRTDAFPAADKQTKVTWLGITGLSAAVLVLGSYPLLIIPPAHILWLAASVGSLVYLVDVLPSLREVTGGSSNW